MRRVISTVVFLLGALLVVIGVLQIYHIGVGECRGSNLPNITTATCCVVNVTVGANDTCRVYYNISTAETSVIILRTDKLPQIDCLALQIRCSPCSFPKNHPENFTLSSPKLCDPRVPSLTFIILGTFIMVLTLVLLGSNSSRDPEEDYRDLVSPVSSRWWGNNRRKSSPKTVLDD